MMMASSSVQATALARLLQPDETAQDMVRRCGLSALTSRFPSSGLPLLDGMLESIPVLPSGSSHVLEIEGESGTGKSFILLSIAARAAQAGGIVFYFDLDLHFSPRRLSRLLPSHIHQENVFIINVKTPQEMLAAIHMIETFEKGCVRLVIIDSLLAMFQMCAPTDPLAAGFPVNIPKVLFDLASRVGFVVIAAKPRVPFEIVSKTWSQRVTIRLNLDSKGRASVEAFGKFQDSITMNAVTCIHLGDFEFNIIA